VTVQLKIETILDSITDQFFALGPLGQWVENHTYPSPDGGLMALQKDITDRKRTEAALAITSPSQGIIEVNDELCRILGYEREELLRMTWTDVTHPDDLTADAASFSRVMAGEIDGYSMDKRRIRKDGRIIDSIMAARCVRRAERLRSRRPRRGHRRRPRHGAGGNPGARGVRVDRAEGGGLPPVAADRIQLGQVILNLVMNAIEAMSPVAERIRTLGIEVAGARRGRAVRGRARFGSGLPPAPHDRIFEAFHTTKPHGMGLAISRSIVEAHGGRLWATPNDGPGATFAFTVPVWPPDARP